MRKEWFVTVKKILQRLGIAVVFMVIIFYVVYALLVSQYSMIQTEKVYTSKVADSFDTSCVVIRKEQPITSDINGYISYAINDGDKAKYGGVVAKVFSSETATADHIESNRISSELESISKLNKSLKNLSVGINIAESQITSALTNYNVARVSGEYSRLYDLRNDIMYYINERKYLTGEVKNYNDRVNYLKDKLSSYSSGSVGNYSEILASVSGVFSSYVDGYEACFDYDRIKEMTVDDYQKLQKKVVSQNTVGKIITEFDWYVVCPVTAQQALELNSGYGEVDIIFTSSTFDKVPAKLVKINQKSKKAGGLAIFRCDTINEYLVNLRNEDIRIETNHYEGLRISKKALRTIETEVTTTDSDGTEHKSIQKVQGVYIKYAKELLFREISILHSASNYVICDPNPENLLTDYGNLKLYDEVVIQGADLYDGKVVK